MTPRLSIIVPFYNVERYIADCLNSLAQQTFGDFEAIMVDDGSSDASVEAARSYAAHDSRFRLVTQENQGLGPARNTGVKHAQGDYLAFVDSDDLVPRHAYEIMIRSLDRTSSSLAAGNARRFNNTSGVRQSYVHGLIFGEDRPATHVFENHAIALDRMVWNKVYRRTFWDQSHYEFPPIRYEDYPITLGAHIDAITVDCIAAPVYYWRERESGESITQLKFQYGNLADRVTSAEMVLDLVDKRAPELRYTVHKHFANIDLATLVQAFATVDEDELQSLFKLTRRLSSRLDHRVFVTSSTLHRLECDALEAGDAELVRQLAQSRVEGHPRVPARRHPAFPWRYESQFPGLRDSKLDPASFRLSRNELELLTVITSVEWSGDALVIKGTVEIAHLPSGPDLATRIHLVCGRRRYRLPAELTKPEQLGPDGPAGFETRVSVALLASLPEWARKATVEIEVRNGWVRRRAGLSGRGIEYHVGRWVDGRWMQPGSIDRVLSIQVRAGTAEVADARIDGDDLVLTGRFPAELKDPVLKLTRLAGDIVVPMRREVQLAPVARIPRQRKAAMDGYEARIHLDDLVDSINPDDPFLNRTVLVPRLHDGEDNWLLLITGIQDGLLAPHGDRVVSVTRSPGAYLNLVEGPARVTADRFHIDGHMLTISGPVWPAVSYEKITWRRFLPNSDEGIDATTRLSISGDRWIVEVDLATMAGGKALTWTLFAAPNDHTPYAVQSDTFGLGQLPVRVGSFVLQSSSGILHLETD